MKVGVIGATGMLGHHTAIALGKRRHELRVIHRAGSDLSKLSDLDFTSAIGDLQDESRLSEALKGLDAVIHCAAYYPTEPRPWQEEVKRAVEQEMIFYKACRANPLQKIVYLGGAIALPRHPDGLPGHEHLMYQGEPQDKNPYLQVKWAMDDLALQMANAGLPVSIAIPGMTFGEFDYGPTTGRLLVEVANRTLPAYVDGKRNCIYAGDAGEGIVRVCEDGRPGERYLLTGENISMRELVEKVARMASVADPKEAPLALAKILAKAQKLRYQYLGGDLPKVSDTAIAVMSSGQFLSGDKARDELGFEARVGLDEALQRTLDWFRSQGYIHG